MTRRPTTPAPLTPTKRRAVPAPLTPQSIDKATAKAIVFGSTVARHVAITESPETLVRLTAERIWDNFETFFALGEWPVTAQAEYPA